MKIIIYTYVCVYYEYSYNSEYLETLKTQMCYVHKEIVSMLVFLQHLFWMLDVKNFTFMIEGEICCLHYSRFFFELLQIYEIQFFL
jgi:hypothetical protein